MYVLQQSHINSELGPDIFLLSPYMARVAVDYSDLVLGEHGLNFVFFVSFLDLKVKER